MSAPGKANGAPRAPLAATRAWARRPARSGGPTAGEARRAALARLLVNADFKEFMFAALVQLRAFSDDLIQDADEWHRGVRAAGAFIRRELLGAGDGAPGFFADLERRYYEGVRRGILDEREKLEKARNEGETR
nr:MAG TPA: hypothetical protein [Caudoviricetes sp.]